MKPLSTKELNYVRDHLSWELLQAKKCKAYADMEPQQAGLFNKIGRIHQKNYEGLLGYMEQVGGGVMH